MDEGVKDDGGPTSDGAILGQIFRNAPLPIAIYGVDGVIRQRNDAHDAFANALGDAAGLGAFNALTDLRSERGGHRARFQRALSGESLDYPFSVRVDPSAPEGEVLNFRHLLMPAEDPSGGVVGVVSVIVDVSDWLRAEQAKSRLQAELMESQKAESLGLLAGGIAHDFNNLLVGVLGNASLLLEQLPRESELHELTQSIELSARRAAEVARQLLAYAGKGQFRVEEIDLSELVRETAELLRITVHSEAEMHQNLRRGLAAVKADATQIRQVVMNLITNARDAIGGAGGHITVETGQVLANPAELRACLGEPDPSATDFVFVEVRDTGKGMDAETAARIFDPFFTTKPTGRGLGLSAVLGIVRSHGGAMRVLSQPGQGTTMRVLLPAVENTSGRSTLRSVPALTSGRTEGGHVLIVDDEESVRAILSHMLEALGYGTTRTANAGDALQALEAEAAQAACVMLDLTMPEHDGGEVFARIRERYPALPVIFMSGYEASSVPPADGFLHKPFTLAELRRVLSDVLHE